QLLTKRSRRLGRLHAELPWPPNVWMGVSVESDRYLFRADDLRVVPAVIRFLSLEPLLGPLPRLNLEGIGWVIAGGESGPGARPGAASSPTCHFDQTLLFGRYQSQTLQMTVLQKGRAQRHPACIRRGEPLTPKRVLQLG